MPIAAAIAEPNAFAEAKAVPEALAMMGKSKGKSNQNPGRVILRQRSKLKPPCKKCKRSRKSKKSKKKCTKCMGIYPIPYPGKSNKKDVAQETSVSNSFHSFFLHWLFARKSRFVVIDNCHNCKHRQHCRQLIEQTQQQQWKNQNWALLLSSSAVQWPYFRVFIFIYFHRLKSERLVIQTGLLCALRVFKSKSLALLLQ